MPGRSYYLINAITLYRLIAAPVLVILLINRQTPANLESRCQRPLLVFTGSQAAVTVSDQKAWQRLPAYKVLCRDS